jgi:hypothetical protein
LGREVGEWRRGGESGRHDRERRVSLFALELTLLAAFSLAGSGGGKSESFSNVYVNEGV